MPIAVVRTAWPGGSPSVMSRAYESAPSTSERATRISRRPAAAPRGERRAGAFSSASTPCPLDRPGGRRTEGLPLRVMEGSLTHLDAAGRARMVDVTAKSATERYARARAVVRMSPAAAARVAAGDNPKGDVAAV